MVDGSNNGTTKSWLPLSMFCMVHSHSDLLGQVAWLSNINTCVARSICPGDSSFLLVMEACDPMKKPEPHCQRQMAPLTISTSGHECEIFKTTLVCPVPPKLEDDYRHMNARRHKLTIPPTWINSDGLVSQEAELLMAGQMN